MAKKKKTGKTAKKRLAEEIKTQRRCFFCDGMGNKCYACGESEADCLCELDEQDLTNCEDCYGTGIASADIKESDLEPHLVA